MYLFDFKSTGFHRLNSKTWRQYLIILDLYCIFKKSLELEWVRYFLQKGILNYFEIVSHKIIDDQVHFHLEEKNILLQEYRSEIAKSKGFTPEITGEYFPLHGKPVLLYVLFSGNNPEMSFAIRSYSRVKPDINLWTLLKD